MPAPWLDQPVMLHSSRMSMCKLKPHQCAWLKEKWHYWYIADLVFGRYTVYFIIAVVGAFTIAYYLTPLVPRSVKASRSWQRFAAALRFLSYRGFRIPHLDYTSPSVGVVAIGILGFVFFATMTLAPKPYYWPNTRTLSFGNSPPVATRTGWMAIGLLPFVVALPMKLNLITQATGISHERLQVFHRWTAYAMFVLGLIHTFPFIIFHIWKGDMMKQWKTSVFYWTGVVALIAQAYLTLASLGPLRKRMYEFFKGSHLLVAIIFVVFLFIHCDFRLTSWDYFIATGVLYFVPLIFSFLRIFMEHGVSVATINPVPGDSIEVVIPVKRTATWKPAQHMFLRFLTPYAHLLTAHPFTICSLPESGEMRFFVRAQKGFTAHLLHLATQRPGRQVRVLIDGPYGGIQNQNIASFDKVILVAGGSGAGLTLPIIEEVLWKWTHINPLLIDDAAELDDKSGEEILQLMPRPKSLHVVVSTRSLETANWYQEKLNGMFSFFQGKASNLSYDTKVHVTGEDASKVAHSLSSGSSSNSNLQDATNQDFAPVDDLGKAEIGTISKEIAASSAGRLRRDRPNILSIVNGVVSTAAKERIAVIACGPSSMLHDARQAAADVQLRILSKSLAAPSELHLHTEAFDW